MPETRLLDLPQEIILRISHYLTTVELGSLRRSCRQIEKCLFDSFAREFFTKRQFMLEEHSLRALVDIAAHPTLAASLTHVIISSEQMGGSKAQQFRYEHDYVSPELLVGSGLARSLLTEAFKKLPQICVIGIRNYSGPGRFRDSDDARWRSYGWNADASLYEHEDRAPRTRAPKRPRRWEEGLRFIFATVLAALGDAGAYPHTLEVVLPQFPQLDCTSYDFVSGTIGQSIRPVMARLTSVLIPVSFHHQGALTTMNPDSKTQQAVDGPLRRMLEACPNIKRFRLNFKMFEEVEVARFLTWLPTSFHLWPHLEHLEFGMLRARRALLLPVLTGIKLKSFSLWKIILADPVDPSDQRNGWAHLLTDLSTQLRAPIAVEHLLIGKCSLDFTRPGPVIDRDISFYPPGSQGQDHPPAALQDVAEYRAAYGSSASDWLAALADRIHVPKLVVPLHDSDASDEDDDDGAD